MTKLDVLLGQYRQAVERLAEVLALEKSAVIRDSALQRFEFTYDLSWKLLKAYLEERLKVRCASPKACFREAYLQGLIEYEEAWLTMSDDRNRVAHLYSESVADEVYGHLSGYQELLQALLARLAQG